MSLSESWSNIEQHLKATVESAEARIEQDLPEVAKFLRDASANPVVLALAKAENLSALPEGLALVASFIAGLESLLAAGKSLPAAPVPAAPQS